MPEKLTYEEFIESLRLSPRLTIELLVEDENGSLLLLRRDKPPFENMWHLPGGFLLKGEEITECASRLAQDELGAKLSGNGQFLGLFENLNGDPRGHILHYTLKYQLNADGAHGVKPEEKHEFFDKLPESVIPYQRDFLEKIGYK